MSQLLKYLIVALLCLGLGALVGILFYSHLSPSQLIKKGFHTEQEAKQLKNLPKSAQAPAKKEEHSKKEKDETPTDKETAKKEGPSHPSDKKEHKKEDSGKKEASKESEKNKDESTEYLRSLWPIKQRKAPNVSEENQGTLYLKGTSPYGPPSTYKEDLIAETKALTIPGSPVSQVAPPLTHFEQETPVTQSEPLPPSSLYQIEVGRFSSLTKAKTARDLLRSKGHAVDVYYTGSVTNPDWFYVRLSSFLNKAQAFQKAQTISILEKIVPTIVAVDTDTKKLP